MEGADGPGRVLGELLRQQLDGNLGHLLEQAIAHYEVVARNLTTVSDTYPFRRDDQEAAAADDRALTTVGILRQAHDAESAGLGCLAELADKLGG